MSETIHTALSGFAAGTPLRDCAKTLFGVLGYRSTRTADVGSVTAFLDTFGAGEPLTEKQRAGFDSWRTGDILFQVTDERPPSRPACSREEDSSPASSSPFCSWPWIWKAATIAARTWPTPPAPSIAC